MHMIRMCFLKRWQRYNLHSNSSYRSLSLLTLVIILATVALGACAASGEAVPASQGSSSLPTEEPASTASPSPATFNENMLKNASYSLPDIGEVQLKDGHFEQKYGEGATQVTFRTYALQDGGLKLLNEISATATP
jgi:hypothetical protein